MSRIKYIAIFVLLLIKASNFLKLKVACVQTFSIYIKNVFYIKSDLYNMNICHTHLFYYEVKIKRHKQENEGQCQEITEVRV